MCGFKRFFDARRRDANTNHCLVIVARRIIESFDFLHHEQCESKDQGKCNNLELSVQECSKSKKWYSILVQLWYEVDDEKVPLCSAPS